MNSNKKFQVYLSLVIIETTALIWFSFIPAAEFVPSGGFVRPGDAEHLIAYLVYGFIWSELFATCAKTDKTKWINILFRFFLPAAAGSILGGICESIQLFIPTRNADVLDWAIDMTGSLFGAVLSMRFKAVFKFLNHTQNKIVIT